MPPLITTFLLTYKRPQLLRRALNSVLSQDFQDFIVCVYDNASNDGTREIVQDFMCRDARVKYHCHAENLGSAGNFKYAWERIETPYFSLLCDDDWLLPSFYRTTMEGFCKHPEVICSVGSTLVLNESGEVVFAPSHRWPREGVYHPPEGMLRMLSWELPSMTGILFRNEVRNTGFLDQEVGMAGDMNLQVCLAARYPIFFSKVPCAVNLTHAGAISFSPPSSYFWPGLQRISENLGRVEGVPRLALQKAQGEIRKMVHVLCIRTLIKSALTLNGEEIRKVVSILRDELQSPFRDAFADFFSLKLKMLINQLLPRLLFFQKKFGKMVAAPTDPAICQ